MPEQASQVAGLDELGCRVVGIPNGTVGEVMQILPSGVPGFGPGGPGGPGGTPPTTIRLAVLGGALTVTVNGVSATLTGVLAQDLAGRPLGYWLPLS